VAREKGYLLKADRPDELTMFQFYRMASEGKND